jgi:putative DNA primase/helicase
VSNVYNLLREKVDSKTRIAALVEGGRPVEARELAREEGIEDGFVDGLIKVQRERAELKLRDEIAAAAATPKAEDKPKVEAWACADGRRGTIKGNIVSQTHNVGGKERAIVGRCFDGLPKGAKIILAEAQPLEEESWEDVKDSETVSSAPEAAPEAKEAEPTRKPGARFGAVVAPLFDGAGAAKLSKKAPYDNAKEFVARHCFRDGMLATYFWQDQFWQWNGRFYEVLAPEAIRDQVWAFLDLSVKGTADGVEKFKPEAKNVSELIDALRSGLLLRVQPPMWLDTGEPGEDWIVFRNGVLNVLTDEFLELTPTLWVQGGMGYDWQPDAKCPKWDKFLGEIFPKDAQSRDCVEEILGYGMTEETKFQKGFLMVGPPRSGKGTLAYIQRLLIGGTAYVGLSFNSWLSNQFSKEALIGRKVGVFPDVRFKPGKLYGQVWDAGGITHTSAELVLNITGEDPITIPRKYLKDWHGKLALKLWLLANDPPNLNDTSGVLPLRFIKLLFTESFLGREDVDLRAKLAAELPGIAVRCVRAYRRLLQRGRFIQPESGKALAQDVARVSNPYAEFAQDYLVLEPGATVECGKVFARFMGWAENLGYKEVIQRTTRSNLTTRLRLLPGFGDLRSLKQHDQPRVYPGLRFKTKADRDKEA